MKFCLLGFCVSIVRLKKNPKYSTTNASYSKNSSLDNSTGGMVVHRGKLYQNNSTGESKPNIENKINFSESETVINIDVDRGVNTSLPIHQRN